MLIPSSSEYHNKGASSTILQKSKEKFVDKGENFGEEDVMMSPMWQEGNSNLWADNLFFQ